MSKNSNPSDSNSGYVLESRSDSSSIKYDTLSVRSVRSTASISSIPPSMISSNNTQLQYNNKSNSKKKKKSKVRTRTNTTPRNTAKNIKARPLKSNNALHPNKSKRRSRLTKNNIRCLNQFSSHNDAIRPPRNFFRTPQPKIITKSKNNSQKRRKSVNTNQQKQVSVAIRLRPLNSGEIRNGMKPIWNVKGTTILKQIRGTISSYNFEYVCPGIGNKIDGTTLNLYNATAKSVVSASCKGINGTIFTYGQTSSGKTYTMLGTDTDPGITLLALSDIFHLIRNDSKRKYLLFISYIEIHNEIINDLLDETNKNLRIVDTPNQGPVIKNCTESAVKTPQDVIQLLLKGEKLRKVSETHSNQRSSRSHAIFRIFIQSQLRSDNNNSKKTLRSVLNLVDLAGSESSMNIDDQNLKQAKEAKHINQSLLCLGRVILALSQKQKQNSYIPYRDSKLTRILQPSLGGNANTNVICTISPCANCLEESLNTLRFAQFTKKVQNHAIVNETIDDKAKLRKYQSLVKSLKKQINEYTSKPHKIELMYEKMKKLKKQNVSLKTKIKNHQKNSSKMEKELNNLRCDNNNNRRKRLFDEGDKLSEYGSDTPSSVIPTIEFTKVIMNLQDKLEEVQGNIATLTNRISTAQFVDINTFSSPHPVLPNTNNNNKEKELQVISIDLASDLCDDTPELPTERQSLLLHEEVPGDGGRTLSDEIVPLIAHSLAENDNYFGINQQYSDVSKFWRDQLNSEKLHSKHLLQLVSGTKLLKLETESGQPQQVKIWLEVQHVSDDRQIYIIYWKKILIGNDDANTDKEASFLLLTSVTNILCGQQTENFRNINYSFNQQEEELSFSLITTKRSFDFICVNKWQFDAWIQCLNKLLSEMNSKGNDMLLTGQGTGVTGSFLSEISIKESGLASDSVCFDEEHKERSSEMVTRKILQTEMNPFGSVATSLNTTMIDEVVDDFLEMQASHPSYPLSPAIVKLENKENVNEDDEIVIDPFMIDQSELIHD